MIDAIARLEDIKASVLDYMDGGESTDMPALFERIRRGGHRTIAYPMHEPWLDVGRPEDLEKAHALRK